MVPRPRQQYCKEGYTSLAKEELIQKAVAAVKDGTYKNAAEAARAFDIEEQYKTVRHRLTGKTKSRRAAHMTSQLLNESQEKILVSWSKFLGVAGIPLSKRTIAPKVTSLCGRKPSRCWIYRLMRRLHTRMTGQAHLEACACFQLRHCPETFRTPPGHS
jgi:hypothetical protein